MNRCSKNERDIESPLDEAMRVFVYPNIGLSRVRAVLLFRGRLVVARKLFRHEETPSSNCFEVEKRCRARISVSLSNNTNRK